MKTWMSGTRGAILLVFLWVIGWGLGFGGLIEAFIDPDGKIMDIWLTAMVIPGFIGGAVFAAALSLAERRRFDEVPIIRFAFWGAFTGIVIGGIAFAKGIELTLTTSKIFAITTILGLIAGIGSAIFFRLVAWWTSAEIAA
jgi:hypothetical protein